MLLFWSVTVQCTVYRVHTILGILFYQGGRSGSFLIHLFFPYLHAESDVGFDHFLYKKVFKFFWFKDSFANKKILFHTVISNINQVHWQEPEMSLLTG